MVQAGNKEVLVAKVDGKIFAVESRCPHMGAPLAGGQFREGTVRCRVHGAIFDLATGKVLENLQARALMTYPVEIQG